MNKIIQDRGAMRLDKLFAALFLDGFTQGDRPWIL
jgi:hypothetical protein